MCVADNGFRIVLFYQFSKFWPRFIPFSLFILNIKFYIHVISLFWVGKNQLKCKKVPFFSEMSEINSRWVFVILWERNFLESILKWIFGDYIKCIVIKNAICFWTCTVTNCTKYFKRIQSTWTAFVNAKEILHLKCYSVCFSILWKFF